MSVLTSDDQAQPSCPATPPRHEDARGSRDVALRQALVAAFQRWSAAGRPEFDNRLQPHPLFVAMNDVAWYRLQDGLLPPLDPVEIEVAGMFQGEIEEPLRHAG
jgi:hypothetical protein